MGVEAKGSNALRNNAKSNHSEFVRLESVGGRPREKDGNVAESGSKRSLFDVPPGSSVGLR